MNKKEFGILFWIHLLLLVPAYFSPLFVDWKIIVLGAVVLQIQYWVLKGCILTHMEMGKDENKTFTWHYLQKIFPSLNPQKTKFVVRYVVPLFLVAAGILLQGVFGLKPLVRV